MNSKEDIREKVTGEVKLVCDIYSVLKGRELYGRIGDKVKVIADCDNVLIVCGPRWVDPEKGNSKVKSGEHKYPVNKDLVSIIEKK